MKTLIFNILIYWEWFGTNHKQVLCLYCNSHMKHYAPKMQSAISEIKDTQ